MVNRFARSESSSPVASVVGYRWIASSQRHPTNRCVCVTRDTSSACCTSSDPADPSSFTAAAAAGRPLEHRRSRPARAHLRLLMLLRNPALSASREPCQPCCWLLNGAAAEVVRPVAERPVLACPAKPAAPRSKKTAVMPAEANPMHDRGRP